MRVRSSRFRVYLGLWLCLAALGFTGCEPVEGHDLRVVRRPISGPLRRSTANPRYFAGPDGRPVLLVGSHTWANFQDNGDTNPPPAFDYDAFLDSLSARNENFFRLWTWEQGSRSAGTAGPYWFAPTLYLRTGPEAAIDGQPRYDLTQFNPVYFARLRRRVEEAGRRGIYVSVMLFNGWSIEGKGLHRGNPWGGHPFNQANNVNGIDGDPNGHGDGLETHTLAIPAITALQEAYVRKVVDTLDDLDNVLYEVSNESRPQARAWQYHMIRFVHAYEATKPEQHPVGMTAEWPNGKNDDLFRSPADWIAPVGKPDAPSLATGVKVVVDDTDHDCGICGDAAWVWKSFIRGNNLLFMDPYDGKATRVGWVPEGMDLNDPRWTAVRHNLGYALTYANRMDLREVRPLPELASTGYCLANPTSTGAEYLIYIPEGRRVEVDLSATPGPLVVEWFSPQRGLVVSGDTIIGGARRSFHAPFGGGAVLYLNNRPSASAPTTAQALRAPPRSGTGTAPSATP